MQDNYRMREKVDVLVNLVHRLMGTSLTTPASIVVVDLEQWRWVSLAAVAHLHLQLDYSAKRIYPYAQNSITI